MRIAAVTLFGLSLCVCGAAPPNAASDPPSKDRADGHTMLWTISKGDHGAPVGYLIGSVHLMKPDAYPLGEAYQNAFASAEVVAFELDFDSATVKTPALIQQMGMYPEGTNLKSELSPETYEQTQAFMEKLGLPEVAVQGMQRMEPWLIGITLPAIQLQQAGYSPQSGIDYHFFQKAKEAGKRIVGFETAEYQFGLFDKLSPARQEAFLEYSLEDADRNVHMVDTLVTAWTNGDVQRLEKLVQDEMEQKVPALYHSLVVERNRNWMPHIVELLEGKGRPLIIVGAAHVIGKEGLVQMLREQGYTVEQQ